MKNKRVLLALSFLISTYAFAQDQDNNNKTLILRLENDWANALITRDESVFSKLLADDFVYTENDKLYNRTDVIQSAMNVADTVTAAYNEDMLVHIKSSTAIVTGWLYINGKNAGVYYKRKYRFTDVWYNNKSGWQLIAAQDYLPL